MGLFIKKQTNFDFSTAEIIFFYIDDFKMFKKQGFCLHPKYELKDIVYNEGEYFIVKINTKHDFIDLFENEKVNVEILCGKNGCGKSSLLELLANKGPYERDSKKLYLLKDNKNKFTCSEKCSLILDDEIINLDYSNPLLAEFRPFTCCLNHENMRIDDYKFQKNITKFYAERPELYDGVVDDKLFTHFTVEIWNFSEEINSLKYGIRELLFKNEETFDLENWFKSDFFSYFLLNTMQDNSYDDKIEIFENHLSELDIDLQFFMNDFVYSNYATDVVREIRSLEKRFLHKRFKISEINEVEKMLSEYEDKTNQFLQAFNDDLYEKNFVPHPPREYLYFRGFSKETRPNRYLNNLSNGEWLSLKYRYEIYHSMSQTDGFWWYIDEPEKSLHPEWCRTFLSDYLRAFIGVKNYLITLSKTKKEFKFNPNKRFTLIFATHSPFLLSDVTNDYIIYLEKTGGKTVQVTGQKDVFAGNIGEMYNTNFFMQNTIGEFARSKLMEIITIINKNEKVSKEVINNWKLLISKIGDDLLRKLLTDKIEMYEKSRIK